ncbi:MAG: hypothetical protein LUI60_06060 [Clostridia bacterium]|nr:hypothetical protein [Clostridia bacterium]
MSSTYDYLMIAWYKSWGTDVTEDNGLKIKYANLYYTYYDNEGPQVEGYYVQNNTYGENQTIRLSVKFNEFVRLRTYSSDSLPYIIIKEKSTTNTKKGLTFNYAGGDGTDTLYFEATVPSSSVGTINVSDLKDFGSMTLNNFTTIVDFTYNSSASTDYDVRSNWNDEKDISAQTLLADKTIASNSITALTINTGTAVMSVNTGSSYFMDYEGNVSAYSASTSNIYNLSLTLNLTNVAEGDYVYYCWLGEGDSLPTTKSGYQYAVAQESTSYDAQITINTFDSSGDLLSGFKSGTYTLYISYTNSSFKTTTAEFTYKFDVDPPSVTLDPPSGYNIYDYSQDVTLQITDSSNITAVEYAVSTSPSLSQNDSSLTYTALDSGALNTTSVTQILTIDSDTPGVIADAAGYYYIYVKAMDKNNYPVFVISDFAVAIDLRTSSEIMQTYEVALYSTAGSSAKNDPYYDSSTGSSSLTDALGNVYYKSAAFKWYSAGTSWDYTITYYSDADAALTAEGTAPGNDVLVKTDDWYTINCYLADTNEYCYIVNFICDGYYTIEISHEADDNNGGTTVISCSKEVYIYGNNTEADGSYAGAGENYSLLSDDSRYLITKYWELAYAYYWHYDKNTQVVDTVYFNEEKYKPVFSTYQQAYDYVYAIESAEVVAVEVDATMIKQASSLRLYDNVTLREGDTWYYYKPASWSSLSNSLYYYYYYSSSLEAAIVSNVEKIVGTSTGSYKYASSSDLNKINSDTGKTLYLNSYKTENDSAMFSSTVTYDGETMYLASSYSMTWSEGTVVYYRKYGSTGSLIALSSEDKSLNSLLGAGAYEFYEIGSYGVASYYVYVDSASPVVTLSLTDGSDNTVDWEVSADSEVYQFYGKSFTLSAVTEIDEWAMVQVSLSKTVVLQCTIAELAETEFTTSGTYTIDVFDRSGNLTEFYVYLKSTEIEVSYSSASSATYKFEITTRSGSELKLREVYYNGNYQSVDSTGTTDGDLEKTPFATEFTFYQSGVYKLIIEDIYGYTYNETITLEKDLPSIEILVLVDGSYVDINNYPDYFTLSNGDTYTILTPSTIRIRWSGNNTYSLNWDKKPSDSDVSDNYSSWTGYRTITISSTDNWMATIGYQYDTAASIKLIAMVDDTPPTVYATNSSGDSVSDGEKTYDQTVNIYWSEPQSAIKSAEYTFEDITYSLSTSADSATLTDLADGTYTVTVTNVLGLSTTFTFTVDTSVNLFVSTSDGVTEYTKGCTVYENEDVLLYLTEDFDITVKSELYGTTYYIYATYQDGNLTILLYSDEVIAEGDEGDEGDISGYEFTADQLSALANGSVLTDSYGYSTTFLQQFGIYAGKTSDGQLYLAISPLNSTGENVYEVHIAEESGASLDMQFVICLDEPELIIRYSANDEDVLDQSDGVYMNNKPIYITQSGQDLSDVVSITYTYEGGESITIYDVNNAVLFTPVTFTEEGTYVVYVTNKYGTVTALTVKMYESIILSTYIVYDDGTSLETDATTIYSNGSVTLQGVSRTTYDIYDNDDLEFVLTEDGSAYVLTLSLPGTYIFTVYDGYENTKSFVITIVAPEAVTLSDKDYALSGWDDDALRTDELYTDTMVSLNSSYLSGNNIWYITYEYYEGADSDTILGDATSAGILLDKITGSSIDNTSVQIGWLGDGLYIIRMYDYCGNLVSYNSADYLAISYKSASQFSLDRITQSSEEAEGYSLADAIANGFYSNDTLIFNISAKEYSLIINGQKVTATNGVYTIQAEAGTSYAEYTVYYCDDYGNKTQFTAYIYTENPQIVYINSDILVTVSSVTYAVGSPSFTCDGKNVTAYYYKDGSDVAISYTLGEAISGDGEYLLYFVDIAGNISTVNFVIDTEVDWKIGAGSYSSNTTIFSGAVTSRNVQLMQSGSESLVLVSATRNGVDITADYEDNKRTYFSFTENGEYVIVVGDVVGNSETLTFTIVSDPVQTFTYDLPSGYTLVSLAYSESGLNVYVKSGENITSSGIYLNGDHTWVVTLSCDADASYYSFTIVTDNTAPDATFDGFAEVTKETITLNSVSEDSTVKVYKDGSLVSTTEVSAEKTVSIECSDYGSYRIVVTDLAGNVTEYEFTIQYTMDGFTIAFIVIVALIVATLVLVVIVIRKTARIR